jgi:RNA polymerase sigma-70 factor, ECF subfamily
VSDRDADRALLLRVIRRDERAFSALYRRHSPYLYQLALRLTGGDEPAAQDLVHEAWVRAVPRFPAFESRSSLRTWLGGFVVNAWREATRESRRAVTLVETDLTDDDPWRELLNRVDVEHALSVLAPGYREVIVLHDLEGYTHQDIATLLGIDPGTSKSQLSRARSAMRRALGGGTQGNKHG